MKRFVVATLLMMLVLSWSLSAQSVTISGEDWTMLLTEYQTLKTQWETSNERVLILESDLQRANEQQQTSAQTINDLENSLAASEQNLSEAEQQLLDSGKRIENLERQLQQASNRRDQLQSRLDSLEPQLIGLAQSLTDTQVTADNALKVIEDEITNIVTRYQRREELLKWGVGIAIGVAVIEAIVIGVQSIR